MESSHKYDFIFMGAGCATLSLVMRMIKSGKFADRRILLIDKEPKTKNDRTWCFWEKEAGFFEEIVYKKWGKLSILSEEYSDTMDISPYQYKMIRGIDLYNYCFGEILKQPNIEIIYAKANITTEGIIYVNEKNLAIENAIVFNSFHKDDTKVKDKDLTLLQHFKGWIIETASATFDPSVATFMDFRVTQDRGTTFAYVLPFTETKALVEYTLFTEKSLEEEEYEVEIEKYINDHLKIKDYNIIEKEFGIIPMTTRRFEFYQNSMYNIGAIGGQTKPSSGYTFQFIQKQSDQILECLIKRKSLETIPATSKRFAFYDKVLLDVLDKKGVSGKSVFSTMFKKNKPQHVLKFLDNESSLAEELKIISTLPTIPFLKAAIRQF